MVVGTCLITVVGQCIGAEKYEQARIYTKKFLKLAYVLIFILNALTFIFAVQLAGLYDLTADATQRTILLIRVHAVMDILIWPLAWTTPNALRAAGDAKFNVIVSVVSMWVCRVAMAYVIGGYLQRRYGMGILGIQAAQFLDWIVRSVFFMVRIRGNRWLTKSLVKDDAG